MKKMFGIAMTTLMGFWLTGCATIFGKSSPQTVKIDSDPQAAKVVVTDENGGNEVFEGTTPVSVRLDKKAGYFSGKHYKVVISKPGYENSTVSISPRLNGWYLGGNFLFGGLIGWLIVDPATGAMWNLAPDKINETLGTRQAGTRLSPSEIRVVLLEQVPENLRGLMVPVYR